MDCKDLMVGDWVICNHYQDKPFTKQFGVADFAKGEYEFCEPIPLTEDILVKNGFKFQRHEFKTTNDDYWISDDKRIIFRGEHMTNSFNKWSVHVDTEDMRTMGYFEITYVHQLQHLLRLCGIKKEIEP